MDRAAGISALRDRLAAGGASVGSWMHFRDPSVAEVMGRAGYDWVALDLEHGHFSRAQLPDLFRALELGGTLPLPRLSVGSADECKSVLDAGAAGVIVPMVDSADRLKQIRSACRWPAAGTRGVSFSRANMFGKDFEAYRVEAHAPFLVAMIEHVDALSELDSILSVSGLDAVLIGPYDLSASLGRTGHLDHPDVVDAEAEIRRAAFVQGLACGVHVVEPGPKEVLERIAAGDRFVAHSMDAVFLSKAADWPEATL